MASADSKRRLDRSAAAVHGVDARSVAALSEASGGFGGLSQTARPAPAKEPPAADSWGPMSMLGVLFLLAVAAYYGLNFFGGSEFDYLKIPLPMVPHTQPGWTARVATSEAPPKFKAPADKPVDLFGRGKPHEGHEHHEHAAEHDHNVRPAGYTVATEPPETEEFATDAEAGDAPEQFPVFTSDELAQAFLEARQAIGCANCDSTGYVTKSIITAGADESGQSVELEGEKRITCPTCRGRPGIRLNQQAYVRLCRLAGTLTFVKFDAQDPHVEPRKQAIRQLLLRTAGERSRVENLGRLAGLWLSRADREDAGVLLAGTVQEVEQQGPYWATRLMLFGLPHEVTILSVAQVPWTPRQRVLVAGYIVDDPAARLPGYQGQATQIVWGGMPLRLPTEAR
ncbi:MAG: hypothetical protein AB7O62_00125 [Pirellulales bacterium]